MRHASRTFLVLLFALLQCVTPLAHAHVGGEHSGTRARVHLDEVQQQFAHLNQGKAFESSEAPVIHMPDGKERNHVQIGSGHPVVQGAYRPPLVAESTGARIASVVPSPSLPIPFLRQNPQAPPALAL